MAAAEVRVVLPGDRVPLASPNLGPGLCIDEDNSAVASIAGLLKGVGPEDELEAGKKKKRKTWVDYSGKRYVPIRGDRVVGVVKMTGRSHRVDIGSAVPAILPELSFEGATKRNKPSLQVGEVVYARVSRANKDMEPVLSCVESGSEKANGLGQLPVAGYLSHCSIGLSRKLLSASSPVLTALGEHFKFECTVGLNGRVWVHSNCLAHTIAISNAILSSEHMAPHQCKEMVRNIVQTL